MTFETSDNDNLHKSQYEKPIEEWTPEEQIEYWNKQIDIADAKRAYAANMLSKVAIKEAQE